MPPCPPPYVAPTKVWATTLPPPFIFHLPRWGKPAAVKTCPCLGPETCFPVPREPCSSGHLCHLASALLSPNSLPQFRKPVKVSPFTNTPSSLKPPTLLLIFLSRISLVAQWTRICLPMIWEYSTCRGATNPVHGNYRTFTLGQLSQN